MDKKTIIIDRFEIDKYVSGHDAAKITSKFRKDLQKALLKEYIRLDVAAESTKCEGTTRYEPCDHCIQTSVEFLKFYIITESLENYLDKNIMNLLKDIRKDLKDHLDRNGIYYEASYDNLKEV